MWFIIMQTFHARNYLLLQSSPFRALFSWKKDDGGEKCVQKIPCEMLSHSFANWKHCTRRHKKSLKCVLRKKSKKKNNNALWSSSSRVIFRISLALSFRPRHDSHSIIILQWVLIVSSCMQCATHFLKVANKFFFIFWIVCVDNKQ